MGVITALKGEYTSVYIFFAHAHGVNALRLHFGKGAIREDGGNNKLWLNFKLWLELMSH